MGHQPSLDDEDQILRRGPLNSDAGVGFQETEADAFAVALMMPKWLILAHCARQGWRIAELKRPDVVYQLSIRLGASYEATVRTLERYTLIDAQTRSTLLLTRPRALKAALLEDFAPPPIAATSGFSPRRTRVDESTAVATTCSSSGSRSWARLAISGISIPWPGADSALCVTRAFSRTSAA